MRPCAATMFDGIAFVKPLKHSTGFIGGRDCVANNDFGPGGNSTLNGFRSTVRVQHSDHLGYFGSMTMKCPINLVVSNRGNGAIRVTGTKGVGLRGV